ncbi:MAG: GatB/YqeY domain-containing protein [Proteobacteria bacterium]|nr:GatB/YqeY domain-containing protein [Pseudomonadota bacterium]MDA0995339.1 GatB/YqeY domain-containing protein [Pseudomonadota bacterium]
MSKLFEKINLSLNESIKKKEADRVLTLRSIVSQKKDKEIELRATDQKEILDSDIVNILNKMMKQRKESIEMYEKGNRGDLAEKEKFEIGVIEEFLPKQMSDDEIVKSCKEAITESQAQSIKDMGKAMKILKDKYLGTMDFAKAGKILKDQLHG